MVKQKIVTGGKPRPIGMNDSDYIKTTALMIEKGLEAYGVFLKVKYVDIQDSHYEFQMDVAIGTKARRLENLSRELAFLIAAPKGEIKWRFPIPGTSLVGLRIPKPTKEYFDEIERERERRFQANSFRNKLAFVLYSIGKAHMYIAYKITGDPLIGQKK